MKISIDKTEIGDGHPPYVIAEISANHNGSIENALKMIALAKENGASAVKIQTYTADTMTIPSKNEDFYIAEGPWKGYYLYDLYKWAETPFEWTSELVSFGRETGITIFSTPFDETAVNLLENLNVPAYKIASFEMTDLPLIKLVASTKKPMIISTGMASDDEIEETVAVARDAGATEIAILHCISGYPTPISAANINRIIRLKEKYNAVIGLSDHTIGNHAAMAAVSLGASIVEKHFTHSRDEKGPDSEFSMEPSELKALSCDLNLIWQSLGNKDFERTASENKNKQFRRSLYFCKDAPQGTIIDKSLVRRIRPGFGLEPKYFDQILGCKVKDDVKTGMPVSWDLIDNQKE